MQDNDEYIEVGIVYLEHGVGGPGFYIWEREDFDAGCFYFGRTRPTENELKAINPLYVEVQ
jgi:hypothetical protein